MTGMRSSEMVFGPRRFLAYPLGRAYRFFKIFLPLVAVNGYKKLNAIYFLCERDRGFPGWESYAGTWHRDCFGPQSDRLAEDLNYFSSTDWILASAHIRKAEPIHYRYWLSPAGLAELLSADSLEAYVQRIASTSDRDQEAFVRDFVLDIAAWNHSPTSWSLGQSLAFLNYQEEEVSRVFLRCDERHSFDVDMVAALKKFYERMFGEQCVELLENQMSIAIKAFAPEIALERYQYLRRDLEKPEILVPQLQQTLPEPFPPEFYGRLGIKVKQIADRIADKAQLLSKTNVTWYVNQFFRDVEDYFERISRDDLGIILQFSDGQEDVTSISSSGPSEQLRTERRSKGCVRLLVSENTKDTVVKHKGTSLIWNLLQPLEVARVIRYDGLEWLLEQLF